MPKNQARKKSAATPRKKLSSAPAPLAKTSAVDIIPEAGSVQDSWAWHPDSIVRGKNYFEVHKSDADQADHKALIRLSAWLFTQDANGELPNLVSLQGRLEAFDPDTAAASKKLNQFLATTKITPVVMLSHAQWVQLWHVLTRQEDVRLVAPREFETLGW
jgi:hypothetical protein